MQGNQSILKSNTFFHLLSYILELLDMSSVGSCAAFGYTQCSSVWIDNALNTLITVSVSQNICFQLHKGVSENSGTPKSSILKGFSIINHPFWGTPIFRKHPYLFPAPQKENGESSHPFPSLNSHPALLQKAEVNSTLTYRLAKKNLEDPVFEGENENPKET